MTEGATAFFPPASGELTSLTRPVAILRFGPAELRERIGIRFKTGHDDLDVLEWARVVGLSGRPYALVRHQHSPNPGTAIVTRYDSADPRGDVLDVLSGLQLAKNDLVWTAPEASPSPRKSSPAKNVRTLVRRSRDQRTLYVTISPNLVTKIECQRSRDAAVQRFARSLRARIRGRKLEVTPSDVQQLLRYLAKSSGSGRPHAVVSRKAAKKK